MNKKALISVGIMILLFVSGYICLNSFRRKYHKDAIRKTWEDRIKKYENKDSFKVKVFSSDSSFNKNELDKSP